jgi:hypothetical protein
MRRPALSITQFLLAVAASASAQAPVITPAGDPSIKDDTIYRLRVDPMYYADEPKVLLLDDGVVRFETDGRGSRTYRQVVQVLTPAAAKSLSQMSISYNVAREKLTVNWARVLDSTGKVISAKPQSEQESPSVLVEGAPLYSDLMVRHFTLSGVAPGTLIDWSYTVEVRVPMIPGDYFSAWRVEPGSQTQRSRFILDLPATADPRIIERHLAFARSESVVNGRRIYVWATQNVQKPVAPELFAPDSSYGVRVAVGARLKWSDVSKWYAGLAKGRYQTDPDIDKHVSELIAGAATRDDTLSRVYRWIAQDFRNVMITLNAGGYQPHLPAAVFNNRYGSSQDRATLFIAIARKLGISAFPVLANFGGGMDTSLASANQFSQMIATVAKADGSWQYADLTGSYSPYGDVRTEEEGVYALVVRDDGTGTIVVLPANGAENGRKLSLVGAVETDGTFRGRFTDSASGDAEVALRVLTTRTAGLDSARRARFVAVLANSIVPGAMGDSLQLFDGRDMKAVPRYSLVLHGRHLVSEEGGDTTLMLPIASLPLLRSYEQLVRSGTRKMPIDAKKVTGNEVIEREVRLTLPIGWRAKLPPDVKAVSAFGTYDATYSQNGRELVVKRRLIGAEGVQPASANEELLQWLREMAKDDVKYLLLEKGTRSALPQPLKSHVLFSLALVER